MNIAINTLALYKIKAGMGNYIVHLVKEVIAADKRQENFYYIYVSKKNKHYFEHISSPKQKNVTFVVVPTLFLNYLGKVFFEQCILPFDLMLRKIDLYHAPGFALPLLSFSKRMKKIVTVADMTFLSHHQYHLPLKNLYFQWMIPQSIKKADAVIAISESTKRDICTYVPEGKNKVKTIYLGADSISKEGPAKIFHNVCEYYGIKGNYILYVGVLEPRKNIEGLLFAFAEIRKTHKNLTLVIAGKKGWGYEKIFALVKELKLEGSILFTGYVSDEELEGFYSNALCFCYPSFYEGFGLPVLEAMAAGCPVITSNISSLKEIAEGVAILVDPHDKKQLITALETMLTNKNTREDLKHLGKKRAKDFSWEKMGRETFDLYYQVMNGRKEFD